VYVALETAQKILDQRGGINAMRLAGCWCRLDVHTLAGQIQQHLPGTRAITVAGMLKAQTGSVAVMKRYSKVLHIVGLLLVCGIIIALVTVQVRRHRPEIGLLLAIGSAPRSIHWVFVIKAVLVGAIGAVLGYLLSVPLTARLGVWLLGTSLPLVQGQLLPLVGACVLVSAISAYLPARRAAGLDPTAVLREE
jgi:ABC-type lipoprotein release transport system permease subunit